MTGRYPVCKNIVSSGKKEKKKEPSKKENISTRTSCIS